MEILLADQVKGRLCKILHHTFSKFMEKDVCCREAVITYLLDENQGKDKEVLREVSKFDVVTGKKYNTMFELAKNNLGN